MRRSSDERALPAESPGRSCFWASEAAERRAIAPEAAAMLDSPSMTSSARKPLGNPRTSLRLGSLALLLRR